MKDAAYRITPTAFAVHLPNESPIYGDSVTTVRIEDEGAGQFVALHQAQEKEGGTVRLMFQELDAVTEAARLLGRGADVGEALQLERKDHQHVGRPIR